MDTTRAPAAAAVVAAARFGLFFQVVSERAQPRDPAFRLVLVSLCDRCRRELEQLAIDAQAAVIVEEERRLACLSRPEGRIAS